VNLVPESCTKYRSEAQKALCLKRSWSDFDPQAYYLYGEDQNHETSFKGKALQAVADSWCKIQVAIINLSCKPLQWSMGVSNIALLDRNRYFPAFDSGHHPEKMLPT